MPRKDKVARDTEGADPRALRTREILEATGITHQILYRYITLGLIQEEKVTGTGQRLFSPRTIGAIHLIQRLNRSGYTLRDIKDIFFKEKRVRVVAREQKGE
jgi:DNA-binding transcriptional MerR regulator